MVMDHKEASDLAKKLIANWDSKERNALSIVLTIRKYSPSAGAIEMALALSTTEDYLTRYTRIMRLLGAEGFQTENTNGDE